MVGNVYAWVYVNDELTHMMIDYEIARFLQCQGAWDVLDIKMIIMLYQVSCYLIVNSNISMTCGWVWVLIGTATCPKWLFNDDTP